MDIDTTNTRKLFASPIFYEVEYKLFNLEKLDELLYSTKIDEDWYLDNKYFIEGNKRFLSENPVESRNQAFEYLKDFLIFQLPKVGKIYTTDFQLRIDIFDVLYPIKIRSKSWETFLKRPHLNKFISGKDYLDIINYQKELCENVERISTPILSNILELKIGIKMISTPDVYMYNEFEISNEFSDLEIDTMDIYLGDNLNHFNGLETEAQNLSYEEMIYDDYGLYDSIEERVAKIKVAEFELTQNHIKNHQELINEYTIIGGDTNWDFYSNPFWWLPMDSIERKQENIRKVAVNYKSERYIIENHLETLRRLEKYKSNKKFKTLNEKKSSEFEGHKKERRKEENLNKKKKLYYYQNLINSQESSILEFKPSIFTKFGEVSKVTSIFIKNVARPIVSFLNNDGGTLIVGVSDKNEILGIDSDLQLSEKDNSLDWLINEVDIFIDKYIGNEYTTLIRHFPLKIKGKQIYIFEMKRDISPKGIYLKTYDIASKTEVKKFFIRRGNSCIELERKEKIEIHLFNKSNDQDFKNDYN